MEKPGVGKTMRVVMDINVLVSAQIKPSSQIGLVLKHLRIGRYMLLYYPRLLDEFQQVRFRPHLMQKYHLDENEIKNTIHLMALRGQAITATTSVNVCRDPDDNILLSLALDGQVDYIVSGDKDLLILNPFQGIPILTPAEFLELLGKP
jgi:putative PIN family toxin of toxin-antitoxin system